MSGGYNSNGHVFTFSTQPTAGDDGWTVYLINPDPNLGLAGTVFAICLG